MSKPPPVPIRQILASLPHQRVSWSLKACICCGAHIRRRFPVIWDRLSDEWQLSPEDRRLMDLREGAICAFCRANGRTMNLAAALLEDVAASKGRRYKNIRQAADADLVIAEINEVEGVHKNLARMRGLSFSEYGGENSQDVMALTYPDSTFDYVLTSDTLEHVPDFDLALSEIRRVLKSGGKHIFTIPVIWRRKTRCRASLVDGKIVHHLPPSTHAGRHANPEDWIVFNEFGGDVAERIEAAGFDVLLRRDPENGLIVTIIATKRL